MATPVTHADAPAAALTRLVARDELADTCARLDVVMAELARYSHEHAVTLAAQMTVVRTQLGRVVGYLSSTIGGSPSLVPMCECAHEADAHRLDVLDGGVAMVLCTLCPCSTWRTAR